MTDQQLLTVEEAAERLRFSSATVRRMLRDKELPGIKLGKREWRVPTKALEEYIERGLKGE